MLRTLALVMFASLAITAAAPAAPATAKEKKKKPLDDIVVTKPIDKPSPSLLKAPAPGGPTPVPYPNAVSPVPNRSPH
ncbi:MAG: hypothetical protein WD207_04495 [Xanthobacteraceae bacterium]